ncbi:hypothetical protein E1091_15870, partial [Micromonospora fluostatini]
MLSVTRRSPAEPAPTSGSGAGPVPTGGSVPARRNRRAFAPVRLVGLALALGAAILVVVDRPVPGAGSAAPRTATPDTAVGSPTAALPRLLSAPLPPPAAPGPSGGDLSG